MSAFPPVPGGGGVGGGLSAYDAESLSPAIPSRRDVQGMDGVGVSGGPSNALVGEFDGDAGGEYGGGAAVITVPGKYLGTNGAGPCMGGPSSDPSVWNELTEFVSRRDSRYARSRRAESRRRR